MNKERQSCVCLSGKSLWHGIPTKKWTVVGNQFLTVNEIHQEEEWWHQEIEGEKGLARNVNMRLTAMQCWGSGWYCWGWWQFICCWMSRVDVNMYQCAFSGLQHYTQSRFCHASKPTATTTINDNVGFARRIYHFNKSMANLNPLTF